MNKKIKSNQKNVPRTNARTTTAIVTAAILALLS
jgi:hypothetical protein